APHLLEARSGWSLRHGHDGHAARAAREVPSHLARHRARAVRQRRSPPPTVERLIDMPETFQYKVKDKSGKLVEGSLEAENAQLVVSKLRSMGYVPIEIQQQGGSSLQRDLKIPFLTDRVKLKAVAVFSRQFATMINSGLSLLRSLYILAEQTESKVLAEIVNQ